MASTLTLSGTLLAVPLDTIAGDALLPLPFGVTVALTRKLYDEISLTDASVVAVSLGGLTEVNVLFLRALGGKVRVRVTTSDGATQAIPIDPMGVWVSQAVGITAIDLQRAAGLTNEVSVAIFMGQTA